MLSIVEQINYQRFALLVLLVSLMSDHAQSCRLLRTDLTASERQRILHTHNSLRSSVAQGQVGGQPSARNMREMIWDDELAAKAQRWANNCQFVHESRRSTNRYKYGQNLAIVRSSGHLSSSAGDFSTRIRDWFNEAGIYRWGSGFSTSTGHYTQLVWANSYAVGCGFAYYQSSSSYNKYYVCNYGPAGNIVGYYPYNSGQPSCSSYGMYSSSRYSGLCTKSKSRPASTSQQRQVAQNTHSSNSGGDDNENRTAYKNKNKVTTVVKYHKSGGDISNLQSHIDNFFKEFNISF